MERSGQVKIELYNDHFENAKRYNIPRAQLIIADIPYNLGNNAYASDPRWYKDGDNKNGESKLVERLKEYSKKSRIKRYPSGRMLIEIDKELS